MDAVSSWLPSPLRVLGTSERVLLADADDMERLGVALGAPVLVRY